MLNMFKRAWKGEASLPVAFWLIYVVFGIIIGFIVSFIFRLGTTDFVYANYANMVMAITFPYTLYSAICVWRCGKNSWILWSVLSKIVVVIGVLGSAMAIVNLMRGVQ